LRSSRGVPVRYAVVVQLQSLLERSGQNFVSLFPGKTQGSPRRIGGFAESACFSICRSERIEHLRLARPREEAIEAPFAPAEFKDIYREELPAMIAKDV